VRTILIATLVLLLSVAPVGTGTPQSSSTPETTAPPEEDLEEFVPSEKIRADRSVSYPVDI
jgi:hypothetical protein